MGALRPQTPDQGRDAPGPSLAEHVCHDKQAVFRCFVVNIIVLANVMLLARRLKAANPDAAHPGKAGE